MGNTNPPLVAWLRNILKCLLGIISRIDFWTALLATMIGVLIAFHLDQCGQKKEFDKVTLQKLHLVFLESEYNGTFAFEVFKKYSNDNIDKIFLQRMDYSLLSATIQDENIVSFLPPYKLSLLMMYMEAQNIFNNALDFYQNYRFNMTDSKNRKQVIDNIKENAVAVYVISCTFQEEFKGYFDKDRYDKDKIIAISEKIAIEKKEILNKMNESGI